MSAIIELTDQQRRSLVRSLNNLNWDLSRTRFGQIFAAWIDGQPEQIEEQDRAKLKRLINRLNIGMARAKAGDTLVELMAKVTGPATAKGLTEAQRDELGHLFQKLNIELGRMGVGHMIITAIDTMAGNGTGTTTPPATKPTLTAKAAPTGLKAGDAAIDAKALFTVTPKGEAFTVKASNTNGTIDAAGKLTPEKAGTVTLTATVDSDKTVTATLDVTIAAAAAAPKKTFKVVDGTATGYAAKKVSLTAADGMKTLTVTDDKDAAVTGVVVALTTAADSSKLGVALNSDGKTIELTPVTGETGDVKFKITHADYTALEITATLA
ncbi:hypothetical protein LT875_002532 [Salmonella enterica]|nr:hypothetical protein [Salmonella enterica]